MSNTPGCYRLTPSVRIIPQGNAGLALCSYPLRVLRLSKLTTSILEQCSEERTCEELAQLIDLPLASQTSPDALRTTTLEGTTGGRPNTTAGGMARRFSDRSQPQPRTAT